MIKKILIAIAVVFVLLLVLVLFYERGYIEQISIPSISIPFFTKDCTGNNQCMQTAIKNCENAVMRDPRVNVTIVGKEGVYCKIKMDNWLMPDSITRCNYIVYSKDAKNEVVELAEPKTEACIEMQNIIIAQLRLSN